MAKKSNDSRRTYAEVKAELEAEQQRLNRTRQQIAKLKTQLSKQERRDRVHRFCEIGGAIESKKILGRPLTDEDIPVVISFLCELEANGNQVSNFLSRHLPEKRLSEEDISEEKDFPSAASE